MHVNFKELNYFEFSFFLRLSSLSRRLSNRRSGCSHRCRLSELFYGIGLLQAKLEL